MTTVIVIVVLLLGAIALSLRNRRRQLAASSEQAQAVTLGAQVVTTSGLYGTVVAEHDADAVVLSIAPGVEVRWARAALRDVEWLAAQTRGTRPTPPRRAEEGRGGWASGTDQSGPTTTA